MLLLSKSGVVRLSITLGKGEWEKEKECRRKEKKELVERPCVIVPRRNEELYPKILQTGLYTTLQVLIFAYMYEYTAKVISLHSKQTCILHRFLSK